MGALVAAALATLALSRPGMVGAQRGPAGGAGGARPQQTWRLAGLRSGFCIAFLIDSAAATRALPKEYVPRRADRERNLPPALARAVGEQPEARGWAPSSLCLYYADTVVAAGRRMTNRGKPQLLGLWVVAARSSAAAAGDVAPVLFAGRGLEIQRAAEVGLVRLREAESRISRAPSGNDDRYEVKIGKTVLTWDGRPAGDSARVTRPVRSTWRAEGIRGVRWTGEAVLRPAWSRAMVGSLRVTGKDDLAKALKASPIRFVGPMYSGGDGEFRFSR